MEFAVYTQICRGVENSPWYSEATNVIYQMGRQTQINLSSADIPQQMMFLFQSFKIIMVQK